jgi:hypothetical protein
VAYYDALVAKWPTLTGDTDQRLAALAALTVPGPTVDVPISSVEGALGLAGSLTAIEDWLATAPPASLARTAARELLRAIASPHIQTFQMSDPTVAAMLAGMLQALVDAGPQLLTQAQVDGLLAMARTHLPWWQANGYAAPISASDLQAAGIA